IPQELQLLVVADLIFALARLLRFLLPGLRAVRHGLLNDRSSPEVISQPQLKRRDFPFFHLWRGPVESIPSRISTLGQAAALYTIGDSAAAVFLSVLLRSGRSGSRPAAQFCQPVLLGPRSLARRRIRMLLRQVHGLVRIFQGI